MKRQVLLLTLLAVLMLAFTVQAQSPKTDRMLGIDEDAWDATNLPKGGDGISPIDAVTGIGAADTDESNWGWDPDDVEYQQGQESEPHGFWGYYTIGHYLILWVEF